MNEALKPGHPEQTPGDDGRATGIINRWRPGPIGQRRWELFLANRRSVWALWIFLVLFVISLFAELVANDRPFFVWYDGDAY